VFSRVGTGVTAHYSLSELSVVFAGIGSQLITQTDPDAVLTRVAALATGLVPGAEHAGITTNERETRFETVAATSQLVHDVDAIQYELGHGPCVDAILERTVFNAHDLRVDERWPEFGRQAYELYGIASMLSLRMFFEDEPAVIAGLNMYSSHPGAFDEIAETVALLLVTHGALAVALAASRDRSTQLTVALMNSREIGVAMGILMAQLKITRDDAFDLMRIASQHTHRKLHDIAVEVADTGRLPEIPNSWSGKPAG
jgi:hypothetical protein